MTSYEEESNQGYPRLAKVIIAFCVGTGVAPIPMTFSLLLLHHPFVSKITFLSFLVVLLGIMASVMAGICSYKWVYKMMDGRSSKKENADPHSC